jgi:PmbA protein
MSSELAAQILKKIHQKNVDHAEVYLSLAKQLKIEVRSQKVVAIEESAELGCGIRIIKNQQLGFAFTSEFDAYVIDQTIDQAISNACNCRPDEFNGLPKNGRTEEQKYLELFDNTIAETAVEEKISLAKEIEKAAYSFDPRVNKTERVVYSDSATEIWLTNSYGLDANYQTNHCGGMAEIIAGEPGAMEAGTGFRYVKKLADLKAEQIGREAAEQATQALGAKLISSQKVPLVFDPYTGSEILSVLATMLSSEAVQKGKSMLAGKLGQIVGSTCLNITDNGQLINGLGSAPFDAEGIPTQETKLIIDGKLCSLLYNTYTANKDKRRSTGNASRGSFQSLPGVGTTNLFIEAGQIKPTAIISSLKHGLYITRILGLHTANPISGHFSVGALGIMIEYGKKSFPVRGITIAGNILEMFQALEAVGSDLQFFGELGSPTLLIHNLTVSGS